MNFHPEGQLWTFYQAHHIKREMEIEEKSERVNECVREIERERERERERVCVTVII